MPKNFIKIFAKYKTIIIVVGVLGVVILALLSLTLFASNAKADVKIEVKPTLTLGPCFNNQIAPKTTIASPGDGSKFITGDTVTLTGLATLECNNSKIEEKDLSWYLDSDTTPFATGFAYTLGDLKPGDHKIKLVSVSGKLKGESTVTINVSNPKPLVLGIKAPPAAPPVPPPNQSPVVSITAPKPSESFTVDAQLNLQNVLTLQPISFKFSGSATDDYDKSIPDSNYLWYIGDTSSPSIGSGRSLTYQFVPAVSCPKTLDIMLTVKDSGSLIGNSKIIVKLIYSTAATGFCASSAG